MPLEDHALLLGPAVIWTSDWVSMLPAVIAADDMCAWPYSVGDHWLASGAVGGPSHVELLLFVRALGKRRSWFLRKLHPWYRWPGRPISVSAAPFGPGIDILANM